MSEAAVLPEAPEALEAPVARASRLTDYVALSKPRLNSLVVATSAAGFYLGSAAPLDYRALAAAAVGTALVAAGASAFNQIAERERDALMRRTRKRPLPDGRMQAGEASWFAAAISIVGLLELAWGANMVAAGVALTTLVFYTLVYTPLKVRSWTATLVGAIPGALPPVIGWAAARGEITIGAMILFAIVFCWQIPHFFAIAWIYKAEYARAGFPFLPNIESGGRRTARHVVGYTAALLIVSLAPVAAGLAGWIYTATAFVLGLAFMVRAIQFASARSEESARRLFHASLIYLTLIWIAMIVDAAR